MTRQSTVGVVLVNYENYADTAECLDSLATVEYDRFETYVVDNSSSDDSLERLRGTFPDVRYVARSANDGFAAAANDGIEAALADGADYVLLLNNDTTVAPDFLDRLVSTAEDNPDAGIVGGTVRDYYDRDRVCYAGGDFNEYLGTPTRVGEDRDGVHETAFVTGCLMFVRRRVFEETGLLREDFFMYHEDVDFCNRYRRAGGRLLVDCDAEVYHKVGSTSGIGEIPSPLAAYYELRNRILVSRNELRFPWFATALAYNLATRSVILAKWYRHAGRPVLRAGLSGIVDGLRNRSGKHAKYPEE